ncbi:MAG: Gfo/Idh/MocA family oxidoreductase [Bacteroidetes bacterium]|nr:Gfo/Idh/MocA family oxidoreductase [Bacteroidota bacterium]
MYKALLIGCGNIGALYDIDKDSVLTHAKAYHLSENFKLFIYDTNIEAANRVAAKYNATVVQDIFNEKFYKYDCISIASPTVTHFDILKKAITERVKVVLCEKPITYKSSELLDLENLYKLSSTKIIVNYIRRFQEKYSILKSTIDKCFPNTLPNEIVIRYTRGFANNCSHALDTLSFLLNKDTNLDVQVESSPVFDAFEKDPTVSLKGFWNEIPIYCQGLINVEYPLFEIELIYTAGYVSIRNSGNTIEVFERRKTDSYLLPLIQMENCIKDYMIPVVDNVFRILDGEIERDNFIESINMNKEVLRVINL